MLRIRRFTPVALAAAAASLAVAAGPAHATTAAVSGGVLSVTGAAGEANNIEVTHVGGGTVEVVERASNPFSAGPGCFRVLPASAGGTVRCTLGAPAVRVDLGDRNDTLVMTLPGGWQGNVAGGRGDDVITSAGASDDELSGGEGADTLRAGDGDDFLSAGGDSAVDRLNGGLGRDRGSWNLEDVVTSVEHRVTVG